MATSSDGGDNYIPSTLSNSPSNGSASGDMRFLLQSVLDEKEKQLQQAGTLGQQLLAQRMELDDRVRMLLEMLDAGDGDEVRERLGELEETIKAWDAENEQFSVPLGRKVNGAPSPLPIEISRSSIPRSVERSKASATGTSAAQSSRRAKNAAHRANDVEFALDIGNGLLTEVRRLQALLTEREQALQDMKEFKDDLEKTVENLRAALREQELSAEKYKEENWNLEVQIQELKTQQSELQATTQRLEGEQKKLTKVLQTTRESADQYKNEVERLQTTSEEQKQKHDTAGAQHRKQTASFQRQIFDLQQAHESTKVELVKAQRKIPRYSTSTTPNGMAGSEAATPANGELDDPFSTTGGASTHNRKKLDTSGLFPLDEFDFADESPDVSPSRPFLAPNHPSNEIEALQQRLAHAQRQIATLKGSLQREKEMRIDFKRKLDAAMAKSDEDDDDDMEQEADEVAGDESTKPRSRLTPYRSGRGRGRVRGRGGLTLLQRLAAHSPSSEYDGDDKDDDEIPPPVPPLPAAFQTESEDQTGADEHPHSPPSPVKSHRTSVDGMDPAFANVLRRSSPSRSLPYSPSPLRHSAFSRPAKLLSRRSRGGAAYQQARPPSFPGEPEALSNELGQLGFSELDNHATLPEAAKKTMDTGCQTNFEEPPAPIVIVTQPSAPVLPVVSEIGIQVDPEPEPLPQKDDVSLQTEEEPAVPAAARVDNGVQHEDLFPRPVLVSCSVETEPETIPEPPKPESPVVLLPLAPILAQAEVQTDVPPLVNADAQTIPEPMPVKLDANSQTILESMPDKLDANSQTVPEPVPDKLDANSQTVPEPVPDRLDANSQTVPEPMPAKLDANSQTLPPPVHVSTDTGIQTAEFVRSIAEMEVQVSEPVQPVPIVEVKKSPSMADAEVQASDPMLPHTVIRKASTSTVDPSVGDDNADTTITIHRSTAMSEPIFFDDDGTRTETASMNETEEEYVDARQSISLRTPTESLDDYHSIMTVTDNDFSESSDDGESIKASRLSSRRGTPPSASPLQEEPTVVLSLPPPVVYESRAVSADFLPEVPEPPRQPTPPPKPEVKEMSIQTDEWIPPLPPVSAPSSPAPSVFRVGPPSQQFQFISPPPSAGPTIISLPPVSAPAPHAGLRDSSTPFVPRPRTSHSDRRRSIESTLSAAIMDDAVARSRTPSNVTSSVDKSRPPMMVLPPPPRAPPPPSSMPPPQFIPEKRLSAISSASHDVPPPRPSSPPPPELIQRATTPTFGSVLSVPNIRPFGLRHHGSNLPQPIRQPSSTSSFRSAANTLSRIPISSPSMLSHSIREQEGRGMSTTSLTSGDRTSGGRSESHHSSVSSERYEQEHAVPDNSGPAERTVRPTTAGGSTDPAVIHAITQTMIGEYLYKYTRKTIGKGHGEKRHKRFFWVHPYTRTLYWSNADPGSASVSESSAKSAYVEAVRSVMDPNPMPPGIYQYSVVVTTPHREMKFTAPTKERHDIWLNALQYLLTRSNGNPVSPTNGAAALNSPLSQEVELSEAEGPRRVGTYASPQSQRSVRTSQTGVSADSWTSTPRGQRSHSQLSHRGSMGKRSGTPAAEYLRWGGVDGQQSPAKSFEHIPGQDDEDLDFELHGDSMSDEGFEGLENVRACCDGRHTVGRSGKVEPHHHHHHHNHNHTHNRTQTTSSQEPAAVRTTHLDPNPNDIPARPVSPAWSFRSHAGSTVSTDGQGFFARFGSRRSKAVSSDTHR